MPLHCRKHRKLICISIQGPCWEFELMGSMPLWKNGTTYLTVRPAEIKWTSKKHEKYYHSIKVGTLGGHNPLCLKSYKIRTPMKNFKKPNFSMKLSGFSAFRTHDPRFTRAILYYCTIFTKKNCMKNCSQVFKPGVVSSNLTKILSLHLEIWFFENFHRGPYYVGFWTKWIMIP